MPAAAILSRKRLPLSDLSRLSTVGLRTRKLRAGLSALGIAIGVAAIVAVLGLSASSQAGLLNEINQLGTNLLTVSNGQNVTGGTAELPTTAPGHDRPDQRRTAGADHRDGQRRRCLSQPLHPPGQHQRLDRPSRIPRPPPGGGHQRRSGPLPQRGDRPRTRRRPRRRCRAAPRDRPRLPRREDLGRRAMVVRGRHPQTGGAASLPSTPLSWSVTPRRRSTWASTAIPPPSTSAPRTTGSLRSTTFLVPPPTLRTPAASMSANPPTSSSLKLRPGVPSTASFSGSAPSPSSSVRSASPTS